MELLTWIINIVIVVGVIIFAVMYTDHIRHETSKESFEKGQKYGKEITEERVLRRIENLMKQIETNEKEITSLKSQLLKLKENNPDKKENSLIAVNDLLYKLYLLNKKDMVKIDGIDQLRDADQITFKNKNGELQNGMSLVFKKQGWFVPFDKNLEPEMLTDEKIPFLVLSVYTENPMGERKNVTFNNPLSVHLTLTES